MSEAPASGTEPEGVVLPDYGDAGFATLMDTLVAEEEAAQAPAGDAGAGTPAGAGGDAAAAGAAAGTGGAPADAGAGGAGAAGAGGAGGDAPAAGAGDKPDAGKAGADAGAGGAAAADAGSGEGAGSGVGDLDAATLAPKFGELTSAFEEKTAKAYQTVALEEVQTEFKPYFDALQEHPRALIGRKVPKIGEEGDEVLRDAADAESWQGAVKAELVKEVRARAAKQMDDNNDFLTTIHSSIELFTANPDLIPGTKSFDTELAKRFTTLAEPYELRNEGKLQGYSVPVQPLIQQIRAQLVSERAAAEAAKTAQAAAAAPAAGAPASTPGAPAAAPQATPDAPQAGIPSKAGESSQTEDFSTLFGTISPELRNIQI